MTATNGDSNLEQKLTESVNKNYDAQQITEKIDSGETEAPQVDLDADYKRAKQYESADEPNADEANPTISDGEAAGDPEAFRSIARSVNKPA